MTQRLNETNAEYAQRMAKAAYNDLVDAGYYLNNRTIPEEYVSSAKVKLAQAMEALGRIR